MSKDGRSKEPTGNGHDRKGEQAPLSVTVISFGYKQGNPPVANLVFDVRFLKNPFWVDELKPLTGRDKAVQDYVLQQPLANEFLEQVLSMLDTLLPEFEAQKANNFKIAFGCTGGQHRSATMVEALVSHLAKKYPQYVLHREHRELDTESCQSHSRTAATAAAVLNVED